MKPPADLKARVLEAVRQTPAAPRPRKLAGKVILDRDAGLSCIGAYPALNILRPKNSQ